jgi:hypothetical protein
MRRVLLGALCLLCLPVAVGAGVQHRRDPKTGLSSWKVDEGGFSLELVQLLPDFVKAAYEAKGFPPQAVDRIARYCVFGTIARNESPEPIAYRVAEWRYITPDGDSHAPKTKTEWVREWRDLGIGFMWSMLPAEQTFEPGDWGQGFLTLELAPGSPSDLEYSWHRGGKTYSGKIEGLRCAPAAPPAK